MPLYRIEFEPMEIEANDEDEAADIAYSEGAEISVIDKLED